MSKIEKIFSWVFGIKIYHAVETNTVIIGNRSIPVTLMDCGDFIIHVDDTSDFMRAIAVVNDESEA